MQNKIISLTIGAILILGTGFFVYATKTPPVVPVETPTISQGNTQQTPPPPQTTKQPPWQERENDDDDDDFTSTTVPNPPAPAPAPSPTPQTQPSGGITLSQIALHNSRSSCWSAVNGSVYDLTSWIPNHPGGEQQILSLCGIDGSNAYNAQHGGTPKPATILTGFKIGTLAK